MKQFNISDLFASLFQYSYKFMFSMDGRIVTPFSTPF